MPFQIDEEDLHPQNNNVDQAGGSGEGGGGNINSTQSSQKKPKKPKLAEALQRLFYNLQVSKERYDPFTLLLYLYLYLYLYSSSTFLLSLCLMHLYLYHHSVSTEELTKSFGWSETDSFEQHDVSEMNRVLIDRLLDKTKKTPYRTSFNRLLEGKTFTSVKCLDVNYESVRVQPYFDLNLSVKGFNSLEESLNDYCQSSILDGDNKYKAEGFGYQRASRVYFYYVILYSLLFS